MLGDIDIDFLRKVFLFSAFKRLRIIPKKIELLIFKYKAVIELIKRKWVKRK